MSVILNKRITLGLLNLVLYFSCFGQKTENKYNTTGPYWVSETYFNCLKEKLPCECEKQSGSFFAIIFTQNLNEDELEISHYGSSDMEPISWDISKLGPDSFQIYEYQNRLKTIGIIKIYKDSLIFFKDTIFQVYINLKNSSNKKLNEALSAENISIINQTFFKKHKTSLENILKSKINGCGCNKWLGGINEITSPKKNWVIEIKNANFFIYQFKIDDKVMSQPPNYTLKLIKKYKW